MQLEKSSADKTFLICTIATIYITISVSCDPLAFRLVHLFSIDCSGAALLYAGLYSLLDLLTRMSGRVMVIKLIFVFHFCDFLFTYLLYGINQLPAPGIFQNLAAYNLIIAPLPRFFWAGILGSLIAGIVEVIVYSFLQKRIKNFFVSSFLATIFILCAHDLPTNYIGLKKQFPLDYQHLMFVNFAMDVFSLLIFTSVIALILKFSSKKVFVARLER